MKKWFYLTELGVHELEAELERLKLQRALITQRIKTAREFGDLSENAEYASARLEQERVENLILDIKNTLRNVRIITPPNNATEVQLGSKVTLKNGSSSKLFQVVGTLEADPLHGKISDESPIGKNLLGKKKGEEVEIMHLSRMITYTVEDIA